MAAVQQGMKSAGFPGTKPNPYRERSTVNLHTQLSQVHGHRRTPELSESGALTDAERRQRAEFASKETHDDPCGPTDTPGPTSTSRRLREKYAAERAKRLRPEGASQYLELEGDFAEFYEVDPYTTVTERDPIVEDADVVILGGGFAGLLAGAYLKKAGVEGIRVIEMAGDFGGVWYWNRFPGIQCDNDAYCYIPLLEELDFMPSKKFADGAEIFQHCRNIGKHFGLYDGALFSTQVRELRWDDATERWRISTDRGDDIRARFVVMAQGSYNRPKLPGIPGHQGLQRATCSTPRAGTTTTPAVTPTAAWTSWPTSASRSSAPARPESSWCRTSAAMPQQLFVFQRTPSSVDAAHQPAHRSRLGRLAAAGLAGGAQAQLPQLVAVRRRRVR